MNQKHKFYLMGLALGLTPCALTLLLYFSALYLVEGNPGSLLSFALAGLYFFSALVVFITAIIFIARKKRIIGITAIVVMIIQFMVSVGMLFNE